MENLGYVQTYLLFISIFALGIIIGFCLTYNFKEAKRVNKEWDEYFNKKQ